MAENVKVMDHCRIYRSLIKDFSYVARNVSINNSEIGKFCSIGPNVQMGLGIHPTQFVSTHPLFYSASNIVNEVLVDKNLFEEYKPINIGNDVWIGANAIILDGIKIMDGAIIAAGAVVTKDVMSYSIVAGIPAKHVRFRFNDEQILALLKEEWWNKDFKWLKGNIHYMADIELFVKQTK